MGWERMQPILRYQGLSDGDTLLYLAATQLVAGDWWMRRQTRRTGLGTLTHRPAPNGFQTMASLLYKQPPPEVIRANQGQTVFYSRRKEGTKPH